MPIEKNEAEKNRDKDQGDKFESDFADDLAHRGAAQGSYKDEAEKEDADDESGIFGEGEAAKRRKSAGPAPFIPRAFSAEFY